MLELQLGYSIWNNKLMLQHSIICDRDLGWVTLWSFRTVHLSLSCLNSLDVFTPAWFCSPLFLDHLCFCSFFFFFCLSLALGLSLSRCSQWIIVNRVSVPFMVSQVKSHSLHPDLNPFYKCIYRNWDQNCKVIRHLGKQVISRHMLKQ